MNDLLQLLLYDYTVRTVALGATALGVVSGALGCFAVLRRQSLLGDALAHAALPGVCLGFLVSGGKTPGALLAGAALTGWLAALAVLGLVRNSPLKEDAALGAVLSVFFGFGIVLLTRIQSGGDATQSGLNQFLFGQAALLVGRDVALMAGLGGLSLLVVALLYKELKLLTFDPAFGSSLGYPAGGLSVLLTGLITVAVVIGLQTVGVVLMAAMLIAPAAAARQWTDRLAVMLALAALFGAFSGVLGALGSSVDASVPTGPLVVLISTVIVLVSLALAPGRGLVWAAARRARNGRRLARERLLLELAELAPADGAIPLGSLSSGEGRSLFRRLAREGLLEAAEGGWRLTARGRAEAASAARRLGLVRSEVARRLAVPEEEVHLRPAELTRALPGEALSEFEAAARSGRPGARADGEEDA